MERGGIRYTDAALDVRRQYMAMREQYFRGVSRHRTPAQSMVNFLITYGWAIVALITAIAAIVYQF